jgi:hypothetical protein
MPKICGECLQEYGRHCKSHPPSSPNPFPLRLEWFLIVTSEKRKKTPIQPQSVKFVTHRRGVHIDREFVAALTQTRGVAMCPYRMEMVLKANVGTCSFRKSSREEHSFPFIRSVANGSSYRSRILLNFSGPSSINVSSMNVVAQQIG